MTGYLALLLTKILIRAPLSHDFILPLLPGSTREDKLEGVLTSLKELNGLQSIVQRKLRDMESEKTLTERVDEEPVVGSESVNQEDDLLYSAMAELRSLI